jgi:hypothetical protein
MDQISRHRSYTTYSEENGILVPSIEPLEKDMKVKNVSIVDNVTGKIWASDKEKLKPETSPVITRPLITK